MINLLFRDLKIGEKFKFVPRPDALPTEKLQAQIIEYTKLSPRTYGIVYPQQISEYRVGSINVEVERVSRKE